MNILQVLYRHVRHKRLRKNTNTNTILQAARANAVLPNAPTSRPVPAKPQKTAEELELEQLEAEMAL